ncbi:MAG: isoprenylcysteine carboxylmethyltransferase family protein [Ruminococcus sp.]|nr:isoprenylcysteine carboxylmethyltransferase family protein [Ruminococcus sp.]
MKKKHLPLYGVGPVIVFGQYLITALIIILSFVFEFDSVRIEFLSIPMKIIGILLIAFGFYLDFSAKIKSELFRKVENHTLITDGIYRIVRNPVYSGVLCICTGIVFIFNNIFLLIVPFVCWLYMTVFLINTEEKWLRDLYGDDYRDYCRKVNRCIPWFQKR